MAQFPILYSKATPTARTGNAEAHFNVDTGAAAIGQSVANIGEKLLAISLDIQAKDNASQLSNIDRMIKENHNAEYKALQETSDPDARIKIRDKAIQDRANIVNSSKNQAVARMAQDRLNNYEPQFEENFIRLDGKMRQEKNMDDLKLNVASAIARGDYEAVKQAVSLAVGVNTINSSAGELMLMEAKNDIEKLQREQYVLNVKNSIVGVIGTDLNKNSGYEYIDSLVAKGEINVDEGKKIGDWMDDYVAGRNKEEKQNAKQIYMSFADKLVAGNFTGDDVALSNLPESVKKEWMEIQKGSRKEPPKESTFDGINKTTQVITDYSSQKIGQLEAIRELSVARYKDESITDSEYKFAINRIKNPYPKYVADTINGILKTTQSTLSEQGAGFFGYDWIDRKEKKRYSDISTSFLNWVETESKNGVYPSTKDMYVKIKDLGVTVEEPKSNPSPRLMTPQKTDATYITTEEQRDKLPSGTIYFDANMGVWKRRK